MSLRVYLGWENWDGFHMFDRQGEFASFTTSIIVVHHVLIPPVFSSTSSFTSFPSLLRVWWCLVPTTSTNDYATWRLRPLSHIMGRRSHDGCGTSSHKTPRQDGEMASHDSIPSLDSKRLLFLAFSRQLTSPHTHITHHPLLCSLRIDSVTTGEKRRI